MGLVLQLVETRADGGTRSVALMELGRPGNLRDIADLGLTLPKAKQLLACVQPAVVAVQARAGRGPQAACPGVTCRRSDPLYNRSSALRPERRELGRGSPAVGQRNRSDDLGWKPVAGVAEKDRRRHPVRLR